MKLHLCVDMPIAGVRGPDGPAKYVRSDRVLALAAAWYKAWCCAIIAAAALVGPHTAFAKGYETLDDLFYKVASKAEGFAGAYYSEDGALTVVVKGKYKVPTATEQKAAFDALVSVFGKSVLEPVASMKRRQPGIGKVLFQPAEYRFLELHTWYQDVRPVLAKRGVAYTDIDERSNRLVIGIAGGKPTGEVVNYLSRIGVPFEAIQFEPSEKLYYYQYSGSIIGSEQRPALGGIELGPEAGGRCTLGINASFPVWWWSEPGFITAGHCGTWNDWWANTFSQPEGGEIIAAEHMNPDFAWVDNCPTARCRFSDSAAVIYDDDVDIAISASVIRTRGFDADVNIDTDNPTIRVTGESPWLLSGDNVHKIGVGSGGGGGWTLGVLGNTCADHAAPDDSDLTFLCQFEVESADGAAIACRGDSGAPVFFWHETLAPNAALAGLLFAGLDESCSSTYVVSPMSGIRQDLGQFEIPY